MEMRQTDPIANFIIQHIGTREHPEKGWRLNFRTKATMNRLLEKAGFSDVRIYDDCHFPGKEGLPWDVLYGCDTLPAQVMGHDHSGRPLALPPKEGVGAGYRLQLNRNRHEVNLPDSSAQNKRPQG